MRRSSSAWVKGVTFSTSASADSARIARAGEMRKRVSSAGSSSAGSGALRLTPAEEARTRTYRDLAGRLGAMAPGDWTGAITAALTESLGPDAVWLLLPGPALGLAAYVLTRRRAGW